MLTGGESDRCLESWVRIFKDVVFGVSSEVMNDLVDWNKEMTILLNTPIYPALGMLPLVYIALMLMGLSCRKPVRFAHIVLCDGDFLTLSTCDQ